MRIKLPVIFKRHFLQPLNVLIVFSLVLLFCPQKVLLTVKSCIIGVVTEGAFRGYFSSKTEDSAQEQIFFLQRKCAHLEESNEFLRELLLAQGEKEPFGVIKTERGSHGIKNLAVPAKVIFRDPSSWGCFVWVNVGERDNTQMGVAVIAKNSPVVTGNYLVGVVEEVFSTRSLVRLITDKSCVPSVCGLRGGGEYRLLSDQIDRLVATFDLYPDMALSASFLQDLYTFRKQLNSSFGEGRYALGNVRGMSFPLWKRGGRALEGFGFYMPHSLGGERFVEEERTLQAGDLLVTSGKDGIFPENLFVGKVTKVLPYEEGALSYRAEVQIINPEWDQLKSVLVLSPIK